MADETQTIPETPQGTPAAPTASAPPPAATAPAAPEPAPPAEGKPAKKDPACPTCGGKLERYAGEAVHKLGTAFCRACGIRHLLKG